MGSGYQKLYLSNEQVETIIENFKASATEQKAKFDDKTLDKVRAYARGRKNMYENVLINGVLYGHYNISIMDDRVAFALKKIEVPADLPEAEKTEATLKAKKIMDERAANLNFSRNQIARHAKHDSGVLV